MIGNESDSGYDSAVFPFMKFSLLLALLAAFLLVSCAEEPPPPPPHHRMANYPPNQTQEYPPPQQPFNPNGPAQPTGTPQFKPHQLRPLPPLLRQRLQREIIRTEFPSLANRTSWRARIPLANISTWKVFLRGPKSRILTRIRSFSCRKRVLSLIV